MGGNHDLTKIFHNYHNSSSSTQNAKDSTPRGVILPFPERGFSQPHLCIKLNRVCAVLAAENEIKVRTHPHVDATTKFC